MNMHKSKPGVYMILNAINDCRYVGSAARSISRRWSEHRYALKNNKHRNQHLQNAWNKYGSNAFEFIVLENCEPELALTKEQSWFELFKSQSTPLYNKRENVASQLGFKHSKESIDAFSSKNKGKKRSDEQRKNLSEIRKSIPPKWMYESRVKDWPDFIGPDGVVYKIRNLNKFCIEHNLDVSSMRKVAIGQMRYSKGWTLYKGENTLKPELQIRCPKRKPQKIKRERIPIRQWPKLKSPEGIEYTLDCGMHKFCSFHNLDKGAMQRVCNGKSKSHKGWTLA